MVALRDEGLKLLGSWRRMCLGKSDVLKPGSFGFFLNDKSRVQVVVQRRFDAYVSVVDSAVPDVPRDN